MSGRAGKGSGKASVERPGRVRGRAAVRGGRRRPDDCGSATGSDSRPSSGGADHEAAVVAAEAERVRQRRPGLPRPRLAVHDVDVHVGVGLRVARRSAGSGWRSIESSTAAASSAPAAPSVCPVTPFVEVTGGPGVPKTFSIASASAASFSGVEVPWALIWRMSPGLDAGFGERQLHAGDRARAARRRRGDVVRVGGARAAHDLAVDVRAPSVRRVPLLEHEHRRAFGDHEAVALGVERPARCRATRAQSC